MSGNLNRRQEIFERIKFWIKQNNDSKTKVSMLSDFSDLALETVLRLQHTIFCEGDHV